MRFPPDIKPDNILLTFEDPSILPKAVELWTRNGPEHKVTTKGRLIYRSLVDFGFPERFRMLPRLGDFGLAYPIERPDALRRAPIQPLLYQAPEVILGVSWSQKADIWNLGCLVSG